MKRFFLAAACLAAGWVLAAVDEAQLAPFAPPWDDGAPGPTEIRIRHTAVGLNFIDIYHRTGLYPLPSLPSGMSAREVKSATRMPSLPLNMAPWPILAMST